MARSCRVPSPRGGRAGRSFPRLRWLLWAALRVAHRGLPRGRRRVQARGGRVDSLAEHVGERVQPLLYLGQFSRGVLVGRGKLLQLRQRRARVIVVESHGDVLQQDRQRRERVRRLGDARRGGTEVCRRTAGAIPATVAPAARGRGWRLVPTSRESLGVHRCLHAPSLVSFTNSGYSTSASCTASRCVAPAGPPE